MSPNSSRPHFKLTRAMLLGLLLPASALSQTFYPAPAGETPEHWYTTGQAELQRALELEINTNRARNIILFIGDGMGVTTVTAARIFAGQMQGSSGEENFLSFEQFPATALAKTYNTNQQTADSAGTGTAFMSGIKTRAGVIGINQHSNRGDCASSLGQEIPSLMQQASAQGMATGFVTTTRVTHATPAATYAHTPERDWESDAELPAGAVQNGCKDIATQLIEYPHGQGINVAMGGGLQYFIPESANDPLTNRAGGRLDGRDLTQEWLQRYDHSAFVWNASQLQALDTRNTRHLLGLFSRSHLNYAADRQDEDASEPGLPLMTQTALEILQAREQGYFLMVEGGRIDHGHHAGNAYRALYDAVEFSQAVQTALDMTDPADTLIIVTADHSHTLTIAGYPTRGNPILGTVVTNNSHGHAHDAPDLAADQLPYTTLGYRDGRGFAENVGGDRRYAEPVNTGRQDLREVDTTHPDFHQEALVPKSMEGHAGEDVAIYAKGPWSHLFHSTHEQHYIYHVMRHALGW